MSGGISWSNNQSLDDLATSPAAPTHDEGYGLAEETPSLQPLSSGTSGGNGNGSLFGGSSDSPQLKPLHGGSGGGGESQSLFGDAPASRSSKPKGRTDQGGSGQSFDAAFGNGGGQSSAVPIPYGWIIGIAVGMVLVLAVGGFVAMQSRKGDSQETASNNQPSSASNRRDSNRVDRTIPPQMPPGFGPMNGPPGMGGPTGMGGPMRPPGMPGETPIPFPGSSTEGVRSATVVADILGGVKLTNPDFNFESKWPAPPAARTEQVRASDGRTLTQHVLECQAIGAPFSVRMRYGGLDQFERNYSGDNHLVTAYFIAYQAASDNNLQAVDESAPGADFLKRMQEFKNEEVKDTLAEPLAKLTREIKVRYNVRTSENVGYFQGVDRPGPLARAHEIVVIVEEGRAYQLELIAPAQALRGFDAPMLQERFFGGLKTLTYASKEASRPRPPPPPKMEPFWSVKPDEPATVSTAPWATGLQIEIPRNHEIGLIQPWCPIVSIADSSFDKTFSTVSLETGQPIAGPTQLTEVSGSKFAYSPDGLRVAAPLQVDRQKIGVWNLTDGSRVAILDAIPEGEHFDFAVFVNARTLAIFPGLEDFVSLWNVETGLEIGKVSLPESPKKIVAVSPDGRHFAFMGGAFLFVVDAQTAKLVAYQEVPDSFSLQSLAFSHNGEQLAAVHRHSSNFEVTSWDMRNGRVIHNHSIPRESSRVGSGFDGPLLAWLPEDKGWVVYGALLAGTDGSLLGSLPFDAQSTERFPAYAGLRLVSGDGRVLGKFHPADRSRYTLANVPEDVWKKLYPNRPLVAVASPSTVSTTPAPPTLPPGMTPPGNPATPEPTPTVPAREWTFEPDPLPKSEDFRAATRLAFPVELLTSVSMTSPWSHVISASKFGSPTEFGSFSLRSGRVIAGPTAIPDIERRNFSINQEGKLLAGPMTSRPGTIGLWNLQSGQLIATLPASPTPASFDLLQFTEPETLVTAIHGKSELVVWNVTKKEIVHQIPIEGREYSHMALSAGGRYVAVPAKNTFVIADVKSGTLSEPIVWPDRLYVRGLAFSADGTMLSSVSQLVGAEVQGWQLDTWNLKTGKPDSRHIIPQREHSEGTFYKGPPLVWLPGDAGWLLYGHRVITFDGRLAGELPPDPPPSAAFRKYEGIRIIFGDGRFLTPSGERRVEGYEAVRMDRSLSDAIDRAKRNNN